MNKNPVNIRDHARSNHILNLKRYSRCRFVVKLPFNQFAAAVRNNSFTPHQIVTGVDKYPFDLGIRFLSSEQRHQIILC